MLRHSRRSSASITAQNSKPISSQACTATRVRTFSSGSAALTDRTISLTADIQDRSESGTSGTPIPAHPSYLRAPWQEPVVGSRELGSQGQPAGRPGERAMLTVTVRELSAARQARRGPPPSPLPGARRRAEHPHLPPPAATV